MNRSRTLCLAIALSVMPVAISSTCAKPGAESAHPQQASAPASQDAGKLVNHYLTMWQQGPARDSQTWVLYLQAYAIFKSGQYKLACEKMTDVVRSNPQFWIAYEDRGYAYMKIGLFSKALNDRSRSSAFSEPSGKTCGNMSRWELNDCGEYGKSAKLLADDRAAASKRWYIAAARAVSHYGLKDYAATKADLKESLVLAFSHKGSSIAADYADQHEAFLLGRQVEDKAADESPSVSNATLSTMLALNGNCNLLSDNLDEAVKDYSAAIAAHPFIRPIYIARSLAYSRLGYNALAEQDRKLADDRSAQEAYAHSQERLRAQTTLYAKYVKLVSAASPLEPKHQACHTLALKS